MKISISRSVARTFAVMEIFKETRQPASATQVSRLLNAPHSSVVAVLHNLRDLGYLSFDQSDMTYFPTTKLLDLTGWLRPGPPEHARLAALAERVSHDTRHMVSLCNRVSLFVNTIVSRPGRFTGVCGTSKGVGAALTASMAGLAILAQLDGAEVQAILRETETWLRDAGARKTLDCGAATAGIESVRRRGFVTGLHPTSRSTEIIAYPVKAATGAAFALCLHVPTFLSQDGKAEVRQLVDERIREYEAGLGRLPNPAQSVRRPAPGRLGDFGARLAPAGRDLPPPARMLTAQPDAG